MYDKQIIEMYKEHQFEDGLPARQSGRLPMIDIAGTHYFVEIRFDWLSPLMGDMSDRLLPEIRLGQCSRLSYDRKSQLFFYDKKNCEAITDLTLVTPENLVLVRIPANRFLDPYRHAENVNLPINGFLEDEKLLMYRIADTVTVSRKMLDTAIQMAPGESYEIFFHNAKSTSLKPAARPQKKVKNNSGKQGQGL